MEVMCRIGDDDPRNSPSSLQRFAGEDLRLAEQRRAQQAQNQAAWAAQHAEHAAAEAALAAESRTAAQLVGIVLQLSHGSAKMTCFKLTSQSVYVEQPAKLLSRQNCCHML